MIGRQTSGEQPKIEVKDTNGDRLLEILVTGGIATGEYYAHNYPWREQTDTYVWNGTQFVLQDVAFSSPQYLYQVVQDADRAALKGDYALAFDLYQKAIYGNYDWFSPQRKQYFIDKAAEKPNTKEPDPDPEEKINLVGYSYFRSMVTYVVQGNPAEAQKAYERIHKNYAKGFPGYDYLLLSDEFWNEYQSSQDIGKACGKVVDFVSDHQRMLQYLGSDYHNTNQDRMYKPEDVCPFQ